MSLDYPHEDKRTLTIAAGRTSPCNMDEDLLLPSNLDDLNPLRHFDPVLDVTDTETIPIPNLVNIEPEKLSLGEKLPLDVEMEVVVKPDNELEILAPPDLSDTLPSFSVMDRHLSQPKAPTPNYYHHRNSYITPPKVAGKRKFSGKIKVCIFDKKKKLVTCLQSEATRGVHVVVKPERRTLSVFTHHFYQG